ncbi:MAG TPA: uroporphyrinogen-III synthase [Rhodanobacteraceae bacterium]|nr:uroporphyrinogen-III synthase [Rhodanobacteraceae bacterium]
MPSASNRPLAGTRIAITRPVGSGGALARRVRALGGEPLSLPGARLRAASDADTARSALRTALAGDVVIFTSPAAVRFGAALARLRSHATVLAPGRGTAQALRRAGLANVVIPEREDSEGLLALPALHDLHGRQVGIVGAAGGRGLLQREIAARGGRVSEAHVYERAPARLDCRHANALLRASRKPLFVLLTSAQALDNILAGLPVEARRELLAGTAVTSSERLAGAARRAGFKRVLRAASAHAGDLLAVATDGRRARGSLLA